MIYLYLALVIGLAVYDIWEMRSRGKTKGIYVYIGGMVIAAVFGIIYLSNDYRPSIAGYILGFLRIGAD